jgi:CMP-N,N'-diacetyllegionaminic acid synthase
MGALAVILARGGSKGVPGKNIAVVGGRPCIAWTIDAARQARGVSRTVVSTDGMRIAAIAREMGAEVVTRPAELAGDTARVDDAARHALREIERNGAPWTGPVVILYANVPVRPAGLIDRALALLATSGCDSVQSYAPVGKYHPWWMARVDAEGRVRPWEGDVLNHGVYRRQDLPQALVPDGGVIALSRAALMGEIGGVEAGPHAFFGRDRRGIANAEGSVIDIDSPLDLVVADAVLRQRAAPPAARMA